MDKKAMAIEQANTLPTNTSQVLLATYNPKEVEQRCKGITTALQCYHSGEKSLGELSREHNPKRLEAMIKLYCLQVNELLNLRNPLNETCIDKIASTVLREYPSLNFADINLVMERGTSGYYSPDGVVLMANYSTVMSWFRQYYNQRLDAVEAYHINCHNLAKSDWVNQQRSTQIQTLKQFLKNKKQ